MSEASPQALRTLDGEGSFEGTSHRPAACTACGQSHLVPPERVTGLCPTCGVGTLEPATAKLSAAPPERVVPFQIDRDQLTRIYGDFVKPIPFCSPDLTAAKLLKRAVRVWWPLWLVDAEVIGHWQASMGYDYEVESAQESFSGGSWTSRKVVETRIRWEPRTGQVVRRYDNVPVPATSEQDRLVARIGATPLSTDAPFSPAVLDDACLRVPDLRPEAVWSTAEEAFRRHAAEDCRTAADAQHVQDYYVHAWHEDQHWTWLLVPIWVSVYTDDKGKRHAIRVNGATGTIDGLRRASSRKGMKWAAFISVIALLMFFAGLLIALIGLPLLSIAVGAVVIVIGAVICALAFLVALSALWPAVTPWRWNSRQPAD